jgi:hypothetical protein
MKLNFTERLAILLLSAIILYASVFHTTADGLMENSTITRKILREDSTAILIDMPAAKTEPILLQTFKTK